MRKRIHNSALPPAAAEPEPWIDLESSAEIEITSEDPAHPIESALLPGLGAGWKASQPGPQTVRLLFDVATTLRDIRVVFAEHHVSRTQEFVLRWSRGEGDAFHEIVRQQYNFEPGSSEVEEYHVNLEPVRALELEIIPSISRNDLFASLVELRLR